MPSFRWTFSNLEQIYTPFKHHDLGKKKHLRISAYIALMHVTEFQSSITCVCWKLIQQKSVSASFTWSKANVR